MRQLVLPAMVIWCLLGVSAAAQQTRRVFAGALYGVSALSADGRAETSPPDARVSLYDPTNGPALNLFAGVHLTEYFSVQANYLWNRNDLTLVSAAVAAQDAGAYEQARSSSQHGFVADALVYFRRRDSRIRPYLGTGLSVVRFRSAETGVTASGLPAPPPHLLSTHLGLRSHVGIDVAISPLVSVRYSFSETISANPISPHLTPAGRRGLMNFQNLFGLAMRF